MKQTALLAALLLAIVLPFWKSPAQAPCSDELQCEIAIQALQAAAKLKPGMHRADLEQEFQPDGGITFFKREGDDAFLEHARYVYRGCPYMKVDVELATGSKNDGPDHFPSDTIKAVSRPYLEYPFKD